MATNNNYKGNNNTGKKAPTPRISAKIDNLVDNNTNLRAFASITVGGAVAVHGLRVMDSKKGLFVSMPSYSYEDHNGETKYADYAHPISKEARDAINTLSKSPKPRMRVRTTENLRTTTANPMKRRASVRGCNHAKEAGADGRAAEGKRN